MRIAAMISVASLTIGAAALAQTTSPQHKKHDLNQVMDNTHDTSPDPATKDDAPPAPDAPNSATPPPGPKPAPAPSPTPSPAPTPDPAPAPGDAPPPQGS